jgi:predicted PurR-regulated permease PerM
VESRKIGGRGGALDNRRTLDESAPVTRETTPLLYAALLAAVFWLAWLVLKPFLPGFVWAAVLVAAFRPAHTRLSGWFGGRAWLASSVVTLLVAAFVVVPVVIAVVQVVQGAAQGYEWVQTTYAAEGYDLGLQHRFPRLQEATDRMKELIGLANVDLQATAIEAVKKVGDFVAANGPRIVGGVFGIVFSFFIMIFMMVVLFASGEHLTAAIVNVLPLPRATAERVMNDLTLMTRSVFVSVGLTALVQAGLAGVMMLILGVPNAFTLTAAVLFAALIPGGTALVWIPVSLWLAANGRPWACGIFVAWCAGVVSTIDNVLRPFFAKSGVKLPGMMLFVGMFGGLIAFGIVGLFLGPIILYLLRELTTVVNEAV